MQKTDETSERKEEKKSKVMVLKLPLGLGRNERQTERRIDKWTQIDVDFNVALFLDSNELP